MGIRRFESKHLRLYTDLDPEIARTLPPLIDRAVEAMERYFGPLPPNREGTIYQMTGYLMVDRDLFRTGGLLPEDLPAFHNGRHRGAEFWLNDQPHDYYRRHLTIHEAVHCYTTVLPGIKPPQWYMEGVAELFGAHRIDAAGNAEFRVMPADENEFRGFGRVELVRNDVAAGKIRSIRGVAELRDAEFKAAEPYAWSWALAQFLDGHPAYRERFRALAKDLSGPRFIEGMTRAFADDLPQLETEWLLFASGLEYGHDLERAAIDFQTGEPLDPSQPHSAVVESNRGWQSCGVLVVAGKQYRVTATGRFSLADEPKPWISEPQGISFDYADGRPVGLLLGTVQSEDPASMLEEFPIGRDTTFTPTVTGTLYLRVNDHWSDLANNRGSADVTIHVAD